MKKLMIAMVALAAAAHVLAMPTKEELAQAQQLVNDLTADDLRALKAKEKTPGEVAAAQLALAGEAETEAGKYLLLQGAFKLYARAADYDAAADVLARMRKEIADLPPEVVVELVNGEMRRVAAEKAPKVLAIFRDAQRMVKYRRELKATEAAAKVKPDDKAAQRRLAECHVGMGDWPKALEIFAKIGDEAAKYEQDPASAKGFDAMKAANYWWEYAAKDAEPFKAHAAVLYKKGLDDGSITGLRKTLAEKRVKEMEGVMPARGDGSAANISAVPRGSDNPAASTKIPSNALYCVIDLSAGPTASKYPVKWLDKPPTGGFNTDEYKTKKLVLRRIEPGKFMMGGQYEVTLTKPFYCGVFELTQKQYELVTGSNPSQFKGDMRPVEKVSWNMVRGDSSAYDWPSSVKVDPNSFMGRLQTRTGLNFDLPTEAQWEYACRAGTTSKYNNGGDSLDDLKKLGRWGFNQKTRITNESDANFARHEPDGKGGCLNNHTVVGSYQPNAWGLYDMHGNVWESCLDWQGDLSSGVTDPQGSSSGPYRVSRGGNWNDYASNCSSSRRGIINPSYPNCYNGFRLCMTPEASFGVPARGSGAPAASTNGAAEPPAKVVSQASAPAVNRKEISVKLATGVTMDFVPCPAGTFKMGVKEDAQSAKFKHTVTITRPFWIGKYQVTWRQWRVFGKGQFDDTINALGGLDAAKEEVSYKKAMWFCESMNKRFKRYIPKGYVYRLPTEAEWEYALHANCSDANDPYVQAFLRPKDVGAWKKIAVEKEDIKQMAQDNGFPVARLPPHVVPPMKVGTKLPNSWGVYDMLGNGVELLLDMVQIDNFEKRWGRNEQTDLYGLIKYKPEEVDPLRMVSSNASCPCCLVRRKSKASHGDPLFDKMANKVYGGVEIYNTFRVVIGPDLMRERGIKLPKLDK